MMSDFLTLDAQRDSYYMKTADLMLPVVLLFSVQIASGLLITFEA